MPIEDIKAFYNIWNANKKTAEQIANEIFNGENGVVRRFGESAYGPDVRRDITQLAILIEELFRAIKKYLTTSQKTIEDLGDELRSLGLEIGNDLASTLDAIEHIVSRITVEGELALIDTSPLTAYKSFDAIGKDRALNESEVVRTTGYYEKVYVPDESNPTGGQDERIFSGAAEYVISDKNMKGAMKVEGNKYAIPRGTHVTPDQYGATGGAVGPSNPLLDNTGFRKAFSLLSASDTIRLEDNRHYKVTKPIYIDHPIRLIGGQNSVISFEGDGCFVFTDPVYDSERDYEDGDCCIFKTTTVDVDTYPVGETIDIGKIYVYNEARDRWEKTLFSSTDQKGSAYDGCGSVFDSVVFSFCKKVFSGNMRYLAFHGCKFTHCDTVFYCEGVSENKPAAWFGKFDFTDCDFRYNKEIFYLSRTNFESGRTLSLNAVTFNGGIINTCNVFCQYGEHNYNNLFRTETMVLNGVNIEKCDFYAAFDIRTKQWPDGIGFPTDRNLVPPMKKWIGGLYIYDTVFNACHIEQFSFLHHGYEDNSRGLIRSQVTFENCYMQFSGLSTNANTNVGVNPARRLIECDDDANMYTGNYSETSFLVTIRNCPMTITARDKETDDSEKSIGDKHYIFNQSVLPLVKMAHTRYAVVFENYARNILVNTFVGRLPAKKNGNDTTVDLNVDTMRLIREEYYKTDEQGPASKLSAKVQYAVITSLANSESSARLNNLASFDTALWLANNPVKIGSTDYTTLEGLDSGTISKIIDIISEREPIPEQVPPYPGGKKILHALLGVFLTTLNQTGNVADTSSYLDAAIANDLIESAALTINMGNDPTNRRVMYSDVAAHYIGRTPKVATSYAYAKSNYDFLSKLPNGTLVSFTAPKYNTEVYCVINNNNGVQILNIANAKDNMHYMSMSSAYTSVEFADSQGRLQRTEWQNCISLQKIDIQFTPTKALPAGLFNGCTSLTDIYVPWPKLVDDPENPGQKKSNPLNEHAPWTDTTGVKVHCSDEIL